MKTKQTIGKCSICGAEQLLSYLVCNYNGVCKGEIIPFTDEEQSLRWWNTLDVDYCVSLREKYGYDTMKQISDKEIEDIWSKEVKDLKSAFLSKSQIEDTSNINQKELNIAHIGHEKPNVKQFRESFESYIRGLSEEDKIRAFEILFEKSKKWDGINNAAPFYMAICRAYNAGKSSVIRQYNASNIGDDPKKYFQSSDTYFRKEFGFASID